MYDFGVELNPEAPTVSHPGNWSVMRAGDLDIAGRYARDVVAVAHPHIERCGQIPEERGRSRHLDRRRAVFTTSGRLDATIESAGDQLHAVADPEDGNVLAQDPSGQRWRSLIVNTCGATGEDDALR